MTAWMWFWLGVALGMCCGIMFMGWICRNNEKHWQNLLQDLRDYRLDDYKTEISICPFCNNPKMYHPNNECIRIYPEHKA
jgi:uncharacterized membrane-anchored protein YhcB (DUF1043 family)